MIEVRELLAKIDYSFAVPSGTATAKMTCQINKEKMTVPDFTVKGSNSVASFEGSVKLFDQMENPDSSTEIFEGVKAALLASFGS